MRRVSEWMEQHSLGAGVLLVLLSNLPLVSTRATVKWDTFDEMWPYLRWLGSALREGVFPDFFPNLMAGHPLGANMQAGVYNLPYLTIAWLFPDSVLSINLLYIMLQVVLFLLMYAVLLSFGLNRMACLYGGLALVASGFVVGHASHLSYLSTLAAQLACLLGLRMALRGRAQAAAWLIAMGVYQMFTAGYPANVLFGAQCLAAYGLWVLVRAPCARRAMCWAAVGAICGLLLSVPVIWHFLHTLQRTNREAGVSIEAVKAGSMSCYSLLNMLLPWWRMHLGEPTMERFHLLWVSVPLAVYALWQAISHGIHRRAVFTLALFALALTVLALGANSPIPVRIWLAEHLFIYRAGRWPAGEHRGFALVCIVLLSAIGLQQVMARWPTRSRALIGLIACEFVMGMYVHKHTRFGPTHEQSRGVVPRIQARFDASEQALIDRPRDCTPDGENWGLTATRFERDRLAPAGFYWDGYVGLRDATYERERAQVANFLCGPSRLWVRSSGVPQPYKLDEYTPGRIRFTVSGAPSNQEVELIWADHDDGFWRLRINGHSVPIRHAPARLRAFKAKAGDQVEMTYAGPLSRLWR